MAATPQDQQQRLAILNHALTVGAQPQRELPCSGDRDLTIITCVACVHRGRAFARFAWGISFGGSGSDGVPDHQMGQPVHLMFAQSECNAAFIAVYHALSTAPPGYNLHLVIERFEVAWMLTNFVHQLQTHINITTTRGAAATPTPLPSSVRQESYADVPLGGVIRASLLLIEARLRAGDEIQVINVSGAHVMEQGHVGEQLDWSRAATCALMALNSLSSPTAHQVPWLPFGQGDETSASACASQGAQEGGGRSSI